MAYITLDDIKGKIPEAYLIPALDDDRDGVVDAWEQVEADVRGEINGILSVAYAVPFDPVPLVVVTVAKQLACEAIYKRRGTAPEANPWAAEAAEARKLLLRIARREMQLQVASPEVVPVATAATIIVESSRLGAPGRTLG